MPVKTIDIFKPHIRHSRPYVGGSTRAELGGVPAEKIYKLSSNENLLGPSPMAMEAIQSHISLIHEYNHQSDAVFRKALGSFFNNELLPSQFITANSGLELIDLVARGFLDPGLEAIVSTPAFLAYKTISEIQGAGVIDVPLLPVTFEPDIAGILSAVTKNTRLIFIANPNNPTGSFIDRDQMDYLMYYLPGHVVVVYDEVYHHYVDEPGYPRAADYIRADKKIIGMHSFSKAYGLAGLRLGYCFSTPEIAGYLNKIRRPFMINSLSIEAGIAALKDTAHIAATQLLNATEKEWLYGELEKLDVSYLPTQANFILIHPGIANDFFSAMMLREGIMVRTTDVFGLPDHIRVTIGTREANEAFIKALKKICR